MKHKTQCFTIKNLQMNLESYVKEDKVDLDVQVLIVQIKSQSFQMVEMVVRVVMCISLLQNESIISTIWGEHIFMVMLVERDMVKNVMESMQNRSSSMFRLELRFIESWRLTLKYLEGSLIKNIWNWWLI